MLFFMMKLSKIEICSLLLPLVLGCISILLWNVEIHLLSHNKSSVWYNELSWSPFIISFLLSISFLSPYIFLTSLRSFRLFGSILFYSILNYFGLIAIRFLYLQIQNPDYPSMHLLYVWTLIGSIVLFSGIFYLFKILVIERTNFFHMFTFMAVFISLVPTTYAMGDLFYLWLPQKGFLGLIKFGFPAFWINILIGWTNFAIVKKLI